MMKLVTTGIACLLAIGLGFPTGASAEPRAEGLTRKARVHSWPGGPLKVLSKPRETGRVEP